MKYIKKQNTPQFFIDDTRGLNTWGDYYGLPKIRLKSFILEHEQFRLCCYCEKSIDVAQSHVEHVKPKSIDTTSLTFDYKNLLVSCEGNHFNEIGDSSKNNCGHFKDDNFDENLFLNPILVENISEYFIFDTDSGVISSSSVDASKSDYTYQILNLNGKNDKLAEARKIVKSALINALKNAPLPIQKQKLARYLQNDGNEFITFLRYWYSSVLEK